MVLLVKTIITLGIILLFALVLFFLNRTSRKKRLIAINSSRSLLSRDRYLGIHVPMGFKKRHVEVLYDVLHDSIGIIGFCLHPDDDIIKMYEVADLDELIENMCTKLGLRKPLQEDFDQMQKQFKIITAEVVLTLLKRLDQETSK